MIGFLFLDGRRRRRSLGTLAAAALVCCWGVGCGQSVSNVETEVPRTPSEVLDPQPPAAVPAADGAAGTTDATAVADTAAPTEAEPAIAADPAGPSLTPMTFEQYRTKGVVKPDAKLTVVDAWATWCGPCKENFPHLVEMHAKYKDRGLNVVSLSLDDPSDEKAVADARAFLAEKRADFTNILLQEEFGLGFEKLGVTAIPAVFVYGPDGKELRRFTLSDAENQFTYDQVDEVVGLLLDGKPLPADAPGEAPPAAETP